MQRTVLWMVRRSATVLWAAAGLVTMTSRANADEEHWITDAKGCKFQNTHLLAHGSVAWSGACVAGYAEGEGILSWTHLGKPNGSYEGDMHAGRPDGIGKYHDANGDRYEGEFYAGKYDGRGTYTFANGNQYEGDFVAGKSTRHGTLTLTDGRRFSTDLLTGPMRAGFYKGPATLLVVCLTTSSQLESLNLVRTSGTSEFDERATAFVRVRAITGEKLVADPVPGCHMVGVAFRKDGYEVFSNDYWLILTIID